MFCIFQPPPQSAGTAQVSDNTYGRYNNINNLLGGISNYWLYPCNYENPKDCMIMNKCSKDNITYLTNIP